MFSSRTAQELLRAIQGMMTEGAHLGMKLTTEVETGSRDKVYRHDLLVWEASRIHIAIEKFRAGLDAGDDPNVPRVPPGLRRLRNSPQAESIRQQTLADNSGARQDAARRMRESTMTEVTAADTAATGGKKTAKKTAKKVAKKSAKKAAPKKAAKGNGERAPRASFSDEMTIGAGKVKENTRRAGSAAHGRLEVAMKHIGKSVKAFRAKGGRDATLSNAVKAGILTVK